MKRPRSRRSREVLKNTVLFLPLHWHGCLRYLLTVDHYWVVGSFTTPLSTELNRRPRLAVHGLLRFLVKRLSVNTRLRSLAFQAGLWGNSFLSVRCLFFNGILCMRCVASASRMCGTLSGARWLVDSSGSVEDPLSVRGPIIGNLWVLDALCWDAPVFSSMDLLLTCCGLASVGARGSCY